MTRLPTPAEMLDRAQGMLDRASALASEAGEELWSDWPPGWAMTDEQAERRTRMVRAIREIKAAIEAAKR